MGKLPAQLTAAEEEPPPTAMAFLEVANDYLDYAKRRCAPKTYAKKVRRGRRPTRRAWRKGGGEG